MRSLTSSSSHEAAQALECSVLGIVVKGKKLILAGDHLQLPPTVLSDEAAHKGLSTTLFERLVTNKRFGAKITTMLKQQENYALRYHDVELGRDV